jgi:F0F1-type ATP synthase assembly protein I
MPKQSKSTLSGISSVGKITSGLLLPILVGFFLGSYLDGKLGSSPWLTLLLLLLGISMGFWWLYKSAKGREDE